ncbi:MAG: glycoside hydrolase family 97 protein [Alistipes sp.]|nr:glycoside hydrolase family 97 protein [Alistipes sp.]
MKQLFVTMLAVCSLLAAEAKPVVKSISSPDGNLKVTVTIDNDIRWSVESAGKTIIAPSQIAMHINDDEVWGAAPRLRKSVVGSIDEVIPSPLYKKSEVENKCNTLTLSFKGDYAIEVRAYDEAAAYRFVATRKGDYTVKNEISEYKFEDDNTVYCSYTRNNKNKKIEEQYFQSFESPYVIEPMSKMGQNRLMFLPVLVDMGQKKVCITESDLMSYPGMYLHSQGNNTLGANFAPIPDEIEQGGHNMLQGMVKSRKPYIAEVSGARSFPWRICIVADSEVELLNEDMVFRLSQPNAIGDTSWIKPGKVAWEWWNNWGLYGVDFAPGINNRTYEYYIDFAAKNGIEYVILDEGWNVNLKADLMQVIPEIDIKHLVEYGKQRGVGIVLWGGYWAINRDMENVFKYYSELGVKGFKIDFMDRDDQPMVDFYERAAATAAKYHLMCDFHGAYKPCGLSRKYPNVVNYEGVNGLEQMKWSSLKDFDQVTYDVQIPFIRMVAGPMDYTQGAMSNGTRNSYRSDNSVPMSQGTRCHQLAMYVVFEAPFNMLCDSPSNYEKEPECTAFIADIPTVWDQTVAVDGKLSEYAVIARRSGEEWYVGGLNSWKSRTIEVDLSFLPDGQYELVQMIDGFSANRIAHDFRIVKSAVNNKQKVTVKMANGGGFAWKIVKR